MPRTSPGATMNQRSSASRASTPKEPFGLWWMSSWYNSHKKKDYLCYRLSQALFITVTLWSWSVVRYSKVEESFPIQATHDLYYHGLYPALKKLYDSNVSNTADVASSTSSATVTISSSLEQYYDHIQFPGVVPRTFVGPLVLSTLCRMVNSVLCLIFQTKTLILGGGNDNNNNSSSSDALSPATVEYLSRLFLLCGCWSGWFHLADALNRRQPQQQRNNYNNNNKWFGTYLLLLTSCQFHLVYYASRMLPNIFATVLTLHSFAYWMDQQVTCAAIILIVAMTVFRCDLILLLFTIGLSWLWTRQLRLLQAIRIGVITVLLSLLVTVPLDSLLWQTWTWPEGHVLYYNTILNKSSDWGTSPWYWYWVSALPKAMLFTLFFVPLSILRVSELLIALWEKHTRNSQSKNLKQSSSAILSISYVVDTRWMPVLLPATGFVALYSFLGHKEVRFLFPALPLFNVLAAAGLMRVHAVRFPDLKQKSADDDNDNLPKPVVVGRLVKLLYAACMLALVLSLLSSLAFVAVSKQNYPGGNALESLIRHIQQQRSKPPSHVRVYIDVASAMTGVSKFSERQAQKTTPHTTWTFTKAGYEIDNVVRTDPRSAFTHMLSEDPSLPGFQIIEAIPGNPRLDFKGLRISTSDAIYVLERT